MISDYEAKKAAADAMFRDSKYNDNPDLNLFQDLEVNNSDAPELAEEKTQIRDF